MTNKITTGLIEDAAIIAAKLGAGAIIGTDIEPRDATILKAADIGTSVLSPTGDGSGLTGITSGPTFGTEQSLSGTGVVFGSIPAGTSVIIITWVGAVAGSLGAFRGIELGDSGGLETSGYLSGADDKGTYVKSTTYLVVDGYNNAAYNFGGSARLTRCDAAGTKWAISGTGGDSQTNYKISAFGGSKVLSGELTQLKFMISAGTFSSGSVNIQYQ